MKPFKVEGVVYMFVPLKHEWPDSCRGCVVVPEGKQMGFRQNGVSKQICDKAHEVSDGCAGSVIVAKGNKKAIAEYAANRLTE